MKRSDFLTLIVTNMNNGNQRIRLRFLDGTSKMVPVKEAVERCFDDTFVSDACGRTRIATSFLRAIIRGDEEILRQVGEVMRLMDVDTKGDLSLLEYGHQHLDVSDNLIQSGEK